MKKSTPSSRAWATSLIAIFCCGLASNVHAQDLPDVRSTCAPDVVVRRAPVEYEGEPGWWFHREVALCMVDRLAALPLYYDRVQLLEQRIQLGDERREILREEIEAGERIEERYETALAAAVRRASSAERELGAWHRSPILWAIVGAVVTGAIVALTAYALDATSP